MRDLDKTKSWATMWHDRGRKTVMKDGKIDDKELDTILTYLIYSQKQLATGIRDVYQCVSRIERKIGGIAGRGPIGK